MRLLFSVWEVREGSLCFDLSVIKFLSMMRVSEYDLRKPRT
jgi:hypothetical protein